MTHTTTRYIGLDIGKFRLDFYESGLGMKTFENTPAGIKKLVSTCKSIPNPSVVCEATSHYHLVSTLPSRERQIFSSEAPKKSERGLQK